RAGPEARDREVDRWVHAVVDRDALRDRRVWEVRGVGVLLADARAPSHEPAVELQAELERAFAFLDLQPDVWPVVPGLVEDVVVRVARARDELERDGRHVVDGRHELAETALGVVDEEL